MLTLSEKAVQAMRAHAEEGYPLEICGFLVGAAGEEGRSAREAWPVRNAWEDDADLRAATVAGLEAAGGTAGADRWASAGEERRFLVSPQDILASMRRARAAGMDLVGVYHTHPEHPAVPSDFDRDAAWPDWSYVILSVRAGKVAELRSWVVPDHGGPFEEEGVEEVGG
jgi:proteasome lid subunit RPN8/RPN11